MNQPVNSLPSDWMKIAKKDWVRMLEDFRDLCERVSGYYFAERYPPLGASNLTSEDIKRDLSEAKKFVKSMFPKEKLSESRTWMCRNG
jgi:HEPN domain-containing protein